MAQALESLRGFGVEECRSSTRRVVEGTPSLFAVWRAIDGIRVLDSQAAVALDADGGSMFEIVWWPALDASLVDAAKAFRDRLANPDEMAAYQAKVSPTGRYQGGEVVIRHRRRFASTWRTSGARARS